MIAIRRLAAAAALAGAAVATAPAHAELRLSASVSEASVSFARTDAFEYQLTMITGNAPEQFAVVPRVHGMGDEGTAVIQRGDPVLSGPGTATQAVRVDAIPACSSATNRPHGYMPSTVGLDVSLPANVTSTLSVPYSTGRWAPWVDSDLALTFEVRRRLFSSPAPGTLSADRAITTPSPRPTGRTGVHITLTTTPPTSFRARLPLRRIKRGRPIAIRGRTAPAVAGQHLTLRYYGPGHARTFRTLARVRADRHGRFRLRAWRPARTGAYELWAFYTTQRARLASDYACPQTFFVIP